MTRTRRAVRRDTSGFIYIVAFASGTVKVGQTNNPQARLPGYARHAAIHGDRVADQWVSPSHGGYHDNEQRLIRFCSSVGQLVAGREYFRHVAFDDVRRFAKTLTYEDPTPAATASGDPDMLIRATNRAWLAIQLGTPVPSQAEIDEVNRQLAEMTDREINAVCALRDRHEWLDRKRRRLEWAAWERDWMRSQAERGDLDHLPAPGQVSRG